MANRDDKLNLRSVRLWTFALVIVAAFLLFYGWDLTTYVSGFSASEVASVKSSSQISFSGIANAPYNLLQNVTVNIFGQNGWGVRLPSLVFGLSTIVLFYLLMRQLTNRNITIFSTVMFAGASWMLNASRLGDPTITHIMWPIAILLVAYNVYKFNLAWFWYIVAGLILGLSSYTPRMIYFVILAVMIAIAVFHRYEAKMHKTGALAGLGIFLLALAPLIFGIYQNPSQLGEIAGTPDFQNVLANFADGLSNIAWKANLPAYLNLGNLPLLNIVELGLATLGILVIFTDIRAPRGWIILGTTAVSMVLISVLPMGYINVHLLLPQLAVLASIGLFTLWTRWRELFPKNEAARGTAIAALAFVVILSSYYHFERYYLAWSRVPETQTAFSQQLP